MQNKKYKILLGIIILILISINYASLDNIISNKLSNEETITIDRVIDGDTVVDINDVHYRLLGIYNKSV